MSIGNSMGFMNTNWMTPQSFNWNYDWNNSWNNFSLFQPGFNSAGTSSNSQKTETLEEYRARERREHAEQAAAIQQRHEQTQAIQTQLDAVNTRISELEGTPNPDGSVTIQGTVQEDGTIKREEKLEDLSTGAKIKRGVLNFFSGMGNVCKSLVGIDPKTGKWDALKCLRNVAIGVGVGALCVFAAPLGAAAAAALGGGAIAAGVGTAIAAVPTALAVTGVATGGYMLGKGVYDTAKADTLEEFDNATQDIGAGALIAGASVAGLRSISKAAGVDAATTAAEAAANTTGTAAKASLMSRMGTSISNFAKDVTVNPWKAARLDFQYADLGYRYGAVRGLKGAYNAVKLNRARVAENAFNRQRNNLLTDLEQRQLQGPSARYGTKESALNGIKNDGLYRQQNAIEKAVTKAEWKAVDIRADYKSILKGYLKTLKDKGEVEINGFKFTSANKAELQAAIKEALGVQKDISRSVSALKSAKMDTMGTLAESSSYASEVEQFGFSTKWYAQPWNWLQSKYYGFSKPIGALDWAMTAGNVSLYTTEPFWLLQGTASKSGAMPLNGMYAYNPGRTAPETATTTISAEEYNTAITQLNTQREQLNAQLEQLNRNDARGHRA